MLEIECLTADCYEADAEMDMTCSPSLTCGPDHPDACGPDWSCWPTKA